MQELFADLMKDFEGYTIGKMLSFLNDPEIISFAGGLPSSELFPVDLIRRTVDRSLGGNAAAVLQYSPIPGEEDLKRAVVDYLKSDDIFIKPDNLVITTSGQHGLDLIGRLFLNPRDSIVIDLPTFGGALAAFELERPHYVALQLMPDGSDVEGMETGIRELLDSGRRPKFIYVVPDFQNPSGITMSLEKRRTLLAVAEKYRTPVVEDSPYRELRFRGDNLPSLYALDENRGNVIGLYTFSKILCLGIRVGFNIGPPEVIRKFAFIKGANVLNTPKLNQDICTAFLNEADLDEHFQRARSYYSEKLGFFMQALEEHFDPDSGVTWTKPEGGLFLWMTVPEEVNTLELFYLAVEEKVAFVPGEVFYPEACRSTNTMRLNFSYPSREQIIEGVNRLSRALARYRAGERAVIPSD
jgi:2-aminoadipate transaminase